MVRNPEGTGQGFLVLRAPQGETIATGDLTQTIRSGRIVAHLVFHFKDGSVDDEVTTFSQRAEFHLLSYHHVQKGPSFPEPMDLAIDVKTGQVTVRSVHDGKEKVETERRELPPDLANGLLILVLKNLPATSGETKVPYLAATPKPRVIKLAIKPEGEETFLAAGAPHKATLYRVKVDLGGVTGVVAPIVGKQPKDTLVWIVGGKAPVFVRMEGQLYEGGPVWTIETTNAVLQKPHSER
jgi:hypothetical protein